MEEDYPRNLFEFEDLFSSEARCIKYLRARKEEPSSLGPNEPPRHKRTGYLSKEVFVLNAASDGGYNPIRFN